MVGVELERALVRFSGFRWLTVENEMLPHAA